MNKKSLILLLIVVAGLGFGVGFLVQEPQTSHAQTYYKKIHHIRYRKIFKNYLLKTLKFNPKKVEDIIYRLDINGFFTKEPKREQRFEYARNLKEGGIEGQIKNAVNKFEVTAYYEYYLANLSNKNNHKILDHINNAVLWTARQLPYLKNVPEDIDASEIKTLVFARGDEIMKQRCSDMHKVGCLTGFLVDLNGITKNPDGIPYQLWDKHALTSEAILKLYDTHPMTGFRDRGWRDDYFTGNGAIVGWRPDEFAVFMKAVGINNLSLELLDSGYQFNEAVSLGQIDRDVLNNAEMITLIGTQYVGGPAIKYAGKVIGMAIPKRVASTVVERFSVSAYKSSSGYYTSLPSRLRGKLLDQVKSQAELAIKIVEQETNLAGYFKDWSIVFNAAIKDANGKSVGGYCNQAAKTIIVNENDFSVFNVVLHEAVHGFAQPAWGYKYLEESFVDFTAQEIRIRAAQRGIQIPFPASECYGCNAIDPLYTRLAMKEDSFQAFVDMLRVSNDPAVALNFRFGTGFYTRFSNLFDAYQATSEALLKPMSANLFRTTVKYNTQNYNAIQPSALSWVIH
jgi:hypothetical protein